jgi:hypothetical protein
MGADEQADIGVDEIIFTARYSALRVSIFGLAMYGSGVLSFFGLAYFELQQQKYFLTGLSASVGFCALLFGLDTMFFRELRFYQDRVVKCWRMFGWKRTIYYSNAGVSDSEGGRWIFESAAGGAKSFRRRFPIYYEELLFPSDTAKTVRMILTHLSGKKVGYSGKFNRDILPKGFIAQVRNSSES